MTILQSEVLHLTQQIQLNEQEQNKKAENMRIEEITRAQQYSNSLKVENQKLFDQLQKSETQLLSQ